MEMGGGGLKKAAGHQRKGEAAHVPRGLLSDEETELTLLVGINRNLKLTQNHIEGLGDGAGSDCFIYE